MRPAARGVALAEDQVEHVQHGAQPLGAFPGGGHFERHAGSFDGLFGAADALCHGCFRNQESMGDFHGGQAADRAQGERDGDEEEREGWQHMKNRFSVSSTQASSGAPTLGCGQADCAADSLSRRRRASSLRR